MENDYLLNIGDFKEKTIPLAEVFLDPNNPRFSTAQKIISENKIADKNVQQWCFENMEAFNITELKESIMRVGFLPIDKIVVRPIKGEINKYVVVEGNRRITALKKLKTEYEIGEISLTEEILDSIVNIRAYIYYGKETDIAWIIQGIRHISGIKDWKPYQQAKLLAKLVNERGVKIEEAGKVVGIGPTRSARLIRSYYAYEQSAADEELGEYVNEDHFSFFQEAVFNSIDSPMQQWLEWSEKDKEFKNTNRLKKYISWFVKTGESSPRIDRVIDVRDVLTKVLVQYPLLFQRFESEEEMGIDELRHEIWDLEEEPTQIRDWLSKLTALTSEVENLPDGKIKNSEDRAKFVKTLKELKYIVEQHLELLERK